MDFIIFSLPGQSVHRLVDPFQLFYKAAITLLEVTGCPLVEVSKQEQASFPAYFNLF